MRIYESLLDIVDAYLSMMNTNEYEVCPSVGDVDHGYVEGREVIPTTAAWSRS